MINQQPKPNNFSRIMLKSYVPETAIIVEAGAHIGRDTLSLHRLFPQATIHAFEPVPDLYQKLTTAVQNTAHIKCYNIALSDKNGYATLHMGRDKAHAMSSLLEPQEIISQRCDLAFTPITVPTITLDTWAENNHIYAIDFLWLDLQGAELKVLQAASHILKTVKTLLIEVALTERYANNPLYREVNDWLINRGFQPIIEHLHHTTWGNVLYHRPLKL